jgi:hypothetical protein
VGIPAHIVKDLKASRSLLYEARIVDDYVEILRIWTHIDYLLDEILIAQTVKG